MRASYFGFDIFSPSNTAGYVHTSEMEKELNKLIDLQLFVAPTGKELFNIFKWKASMNGLKAEYARFTLWPKFYLAPALPLNAISYYSVLNKVKEFNPDIIHIRYHSPNPFGWRIAEKIGAPIILEVNSPYVEDEAYKGYIMKRICKRDREEQFKHCKAVITQTETLKSIIKPHTDKPIYVVPNGVNTEKFIPSESLKEATRKRMGIAEEDIVITFSGSLKKWHGGHLLKQIEEMVMEKHKNVKFQLLKDKDYDILPYYLNISDICIAPFSSYNFKYIDEYGFWWNPIKLYEYMAMAKPIVSFDYEEVSKICKESALLAKPEDVYDFVDKINYLIEHEGERKIMGDRAREIALNEYDWEKRARETIEVYTEILEC